MPTASLSTDPQGPIMSSVPSHGTGSCHVLQTEGHPSNILYSFNTKDLHTTALPSCFERKVIQHVNIWNTAGMMGKAGMKEVLCWKMLRAAISQSFDLETLPDLVKTAGSANQMARTLYVPSFSLLVFQLPLKSMRFFSLQKLNIPSNFSVVEVWKPNTGMQWNADRCIILLGTTKASFTILPLLSFANINPKWLQKKTVKLHQIKTGSSEARTR